MLQRFLHQESVDGAVDDQPLAGPTLAIGTAANLVRISLFPKSIPRKQACPVQLVHMEKLVTGEASQKEVRITFYAKVFGLDCLGTGRILS